MSGSSNKASKVCLSFRAMVRLSSTVAFVTCLFSCAVAEAKKPKHIVFFLIDDYGFSDASYKAKMYQGTAPPPTPHIDAMAEGGVRLESYYVHQLCSPTRTALLSGRYAYSIGQEDGVIIDGHDGDTPLNLLTIADHLQKAGWRTSAYGKWDAGMTTWGSTPTCRGFDHFYGFYSAATDHFYHHVGNGLDLRDDLKAVTDKGGVYSTELFTQAAQAWIERTMAKEPDAKTFAYVAHEAVHGPLDAPKRFVDGPCEDLVPEDNPARRIYCGMVRGVDESVYNLTETYKKLGIYDDTLWIMSADNGGIPKDGGSNFPLRGNKATTWEGGVRALGWVHGAGLTDKVIGSICHEVMHVTDWLPTIAGGIAGVDLSHLGRDCPTCKTPVMPLDGVDQWAMLSAGAASSRNETLLELHGAFGCWSHKKGCDIPGQGAIRVGKWKLLHGYTTTVPTAEECVIRSGLAGWYATEADESGKPVRVTFGSNQSTPWCPNGWTPAPHTGSDSGVMQPRPPPDVECPTVPCTFEGSPYSAGGTWLFNIVADPFEHENVAAKHPDIVEQLLARLQSYNATGVVQEKQQLDPKADPKNFNGVWTPWRGNPNPAVCDTNKIVPPHGTFRSSLNTKFKIHNASGKLSMTISGWAWNSSFPDGGLSPVAIRIAVDNEAPVVSGLVADITRPGVPATGAPNAKHGFSYVLTGEAAEVLLSQGKHALHVLVGSYPATSELKQRWTNVSPKSPVAFVNGAPHTESDLVV